MALELLDHCRFTGPALPEPFVRFDLEAALSAADLLPKAKDLADGWDFHRRKLRDLGERGGSVRVLNHVVEPLLEPLGYARVEAAIEVSTREGPEPGGHLLIAMSPSLEGAAPSAPRSTPPHLRVWAYAFDEDLDAPPSRAAYRFSPVRVAQRVLLAAGERVGLITNGAELRILISDPARPDSEISIDLVSDWRRAREVPDSFRLLVALASPRGVVAVPDLVEKARLQQARVTKELRTQAREAIEGFAQEILDHPENRTTLAARTDHDALARELWREGLIVVYRLLFILKLESTDDPARAFRFASSSLWRTTFSPSTALAPFVRSRIDEHADTGELLETGLRTLFRMFAEGLSTPEIHVAPLGGALFGPNATPLLASLRWGERAVAQLLDRLLWTERQRGGRARERVHYGPLDVEDLGRVYEALLELEPGIATEPMCRLRRQKLEVVVPLAQGDRYRASAGDHRSATDSAAAPPAGGRRSVAAAASDHAEADALAEDTVIDGADAPSENPDATRGRAVVGAGLVPARSAHDDDDLDASPDAGDTDDQATDDLDEPKRGKKTKVEWIEEIHSGRFYLRVGLGRKSSGSYYTPHSFVRFLVQETLGPQVAERSPTTDPNPAAILALKALDPAMGSGHFLVEACRFLGEKLYEACRLCDEKAREAEEAVARGLVPRETNDAVATATKWRARLLDLPDPNDELAYLPTHAPEDTAPGLSEQKALALCRRLVAVHCLYGVDKNPLAVELAKLSLWLESHAEGLPLTFLDHRLILGDSLTGPFFEHLLTFPGTQQPLDDLFTQGLRDQLTKALAEALAHVRDLEATVGAKLADLHAKQAALAKLNAALAPFHSLAAVWAGGVLVGGRECDDVGYGDLARSIAEIGSADPDILARPTVARMLFTGGLTWGAPTPRALAYDLTFPEVFFAAGSPSERRGFDAVLGNPPWDAVQPLAKEFFASYDLRILDAPTRRERATVERHVLADPGASAGYRTYVGGLDAVKRGAERLYEHVNQSAGGAASGAVLDLWQLFAERGVRLLSTSGFVGWVLPSAFHANQSATGIRDLYLNRCSLRRCYSFENRRRLFEIHSSYKFATIVASRTGPTRSFHCGFYLDDDEWLFASHEPLVYTREFIERTGGEFLSFYELRTVNDVAVAARLATDARPLATVLDRCRIRCGEELHMSKCAHLFTPASEAIGAGEDCREPNTAEELRGAGYLPLHEGKTFHQYNDRWGDPPRYLVNIRHIVDRPAWARPACHFRLAFRDIASSTNERTGIFSLLPPGVACGNKAPCEREPRGRPTFAALVLLTVANSYPFDFLLRTKVQATVNLFILGGCPVPDLKTRTEARTFLAHSALRLSCNHAGYAPLWHEQVGLVWREPTPPLTWPVLAEDDARWGIRAAIDAVVADAYGLSRGQYAHVLSTFSHKSYPKAPDLCLITFDELKAIGLEAFTRKHDPYWDIPLNEDLPQPVIDLPIPADAESAAAGGTQVGLDLIGGSSQPRRKSRRDRSTPRTADRPAARESAAAAPSDLSGAIAGALPLATETPARSAEHLSTGSLGNSGTAGRRSRPAERSASDGGLAPAAFERVKALLAERQVITSADVQYILATDAAGARPYLQALVTEGLAVTEGQRRGTKYRATHSSD